MIVGKRQPFYTYGNKNDNRLHTQIRLGMSPLNSLQYTITKCPISKCSCGHFAEDTVHVALRCSKFQLHRTQLFTNVSRILQCDFNALKANKKSDILLHGTGLNVCQDPSVASEFQKFIIRTGRFEWWVTYICTITVVEVKAEWCVSHRIRYCCGSLSSSSSHRGAARRYQRKTSSRPRYQGHSRSRNKC